MGCGSSSAHAEPKEFEQPQEKVAAVTQKSSEPSAEDELIDQIVEKLESRVVEESALLNNTKEKFDLPPSTALQAKAFELRKRKNSASSSKVTLPPSPKQYRPTPIHSTPDYRNLRKSVNKFEETSMDEHGTPDGLECKLCWADMDMSNYVEYKTHEDDEKWYVSGYCSDCIKVLIETQWKTFTEMVGKETCRAAVLRLCNAVPLYIKDWIALPCHQHSEPKLKKKDKDAAPSAEEAKDEKPPCPTFGQVALLWYSVNNEVVNPQLKDAPVGDERDQYITNLEEFAALLEDTEATGDAVSAE